MTKAERRQLRKERRQAKRREERQARREQRRLDKLADQQHDQDHDHDHHDTHDQEKVVFEFVDPRLNPDASPDSLIGDDSVDWRASFFTDRVKLTDNIFDVTIDKATMSLVAQTYITDLIQEIDSITGTQIAIGRSGVKPDLLIEKTDNWSEYGALSGQDTSGYAGLAFFDNDIVHATWKETSTYATGALTTETEYVIGHEILHGFGLMHPGDNGYNPDFNTHDTLLSYTRSGNSQLTALDQAALQQLWG